MDLEGLALIMDSLSFAFYMESHSIGNMVVIKKYVLADYTLILCLLTSWANDIHSLVSHTFHLCQPVHRSFITLSYRCYPQELAIE